MKEWSETSPILMIIINKTNMRGKKKNGLRGLDDKGVTPTTDAVVTNDRKEEGDTSGINNPTINSNVSTGTVTSVVEKDKGGVIVAAKEASAAPVDVDSRGTTTDVSNTEVVKGEDGKVDAIVKLEEKKEEIKKTLDVVKEEGEYEEEEYYEEDYYEDAFEFDEELTASEHQRGMLTYPA
jgi:hypothetical protein